MAPFGVSDDEWILRQLSRFRLRISQGEDAGEQSLHQINVVGEHREQLVTLEPQCPAILAHRRPPPRTWFQPAGRPPDRGTSGRDRRARSWVFEYDTSP